MERRVRFFNGGVGDAFGLKLTTELTKSFQVGHQGNGSGVSREMKPESTRLTRSVDGLGGDLSGRQISSENDVVEERSTAKGSVESV